MTDLLTLVGAALQRPTAQLAELDRRPLRLAFVEGSYVTVTVRDKVSREVVDITLDPQTGETFSAAELRAMDAREGQSLGTLTPELLSTLLRHPELAALEVRVTKAGAARPLVASAARIAALARAPGVRRIDLSGDPQIRDDG